MTEPKRPEIRMGTGHVQRVDLDSLDAVYRFAKGVALAGWAPKSYREDPRNADSPFSVDKIALGILHGAEVGLRPLAALRGIAVINGTPSLWGDAMMAVVRASGELEEFKEWEVVPTTDNPTAHCRVKRRGQDPVERSFGQDDARKAQLAGKAGPWQTYPQRMRAMRARSWALRDAFSDVLSGLGAAEEQEDEDQRAERATDVTPRPREADYRATRGQIEHSDEEPLDDVAMQALDEMIPEGLRTELVAAERERVAAEMETDFAGPTTTNTKTQREADRPPADAARKAAPAPQETAQAGGRDSHDGAPPAVDPKRDGAADAASGSAAPSPRHQERSTAPADVSAANRALAEPPAADTPLLPLTPPGITLALQQGNDVAWLDWFCQQLVELEPLPRSEFIASWAPMIDKFADRRGANWARLDAALNIPKGALL